MQKHIRYEIELIMDPASAPSIHRVLEFFEQAFQLPTIEVSLASPSRRGRPRKSASPPSPAAGDHSTAPQPPASSEEQVFTVRRTDTSVDAYLAELDEAAEILRKHRTPPAPKPWDPAPRAPDSYTPFMWQPVAPVCTTPGSEYTVIERPATITEIDETA